MGIQLVEHVVKYAPADLSPGQYVVLLIVAKHARDETREAFPGMDVLSKDCRMPKRTVRWTLAELAARGIELRVSWGTGKDGRPIYSCPGRRTTYRVPVLFWLDKQEAGSAEKAPAESVGNPPEQDPDPVDNPPIRGQPAAALGGKIPPEWRQDPVDKAATSRRPSRQSLVMKSSKIRARDATTAAAVDALRSRTGVEVTDAWARTVVDQVLADARGPVRQPARYVRRAIERDEHPERFLPTPGPPHSQPPDDRTPR